MTSLSYALTTSASYSLTGYSLGALGPWVESIWPLDNLLPTGPITPESTAGLTLGTEFSVTEAGEVTAVRFYRQTGANSTFTVAIYNQTAGTLLGSKVASGLSTVGWQTITLDTPVAVAAGTTYAVAYHQAAAGGQVFYPGQAGYFSGGRYAMSQGERIVIDSGLYNYGASIARPTNTSTACYFADPVISFPTQANPAAYGPADPTDPFPPLAGYPNSSNTGVPAGEQMTIYVGEFLVDRAYTLSNMEVRGAIQITVNGSTITKCRVLSGWLRCISMSANITATVTYCTLRNYTLGGTSDGIYGGGTFEYNNMAWIDNGIKLAVNGAIIRYNYIYGFGFIPENESGGEPHSDGIEVFGGGNHLIEHNTIALNLGQTSVINIAPEFTSIADVIVRDNYLCGGGYTIAVRTNVGVPAYSITDVLIEDNFIRAGFYGAYDIQVQVTDDPVVPDGDTIL